jgi:hypothetical protein
MPPSGNQIWYLDAMQNASPMLCYRLFTRLLPALRVCFHFLFFSRTISEHLTRYFEHINSVLNFG